MGFYVGVNYFKCEWINGFKSKKCMGNIVMYKIK